MKLSRDRILDTALAVVDLDGWRALSMRRLAQELDVWPMAIYRHFADKEALLAAVAVAAAERAQLPAGAQDATDAGWREVLPALLVEARRLLGDDEGGVAAVRSLAEPPSPLAAAAVEALGEAGLDAERAAEVWRALLAYAVGSRALTVTAEDVRFRAGLAELLDGIAATAHAGARAGA